MTYLAQWTLAGRLMKVRALPRWIPRAMVGVCLAVLLLALASLPTKEWALDRRIVGNVFEWNLSVLMVLHYALAWRAWRSTGFPRRASE